MRARVPDKKILVEMALLVAGCVALGAILLKRDDGSKAVPFSTATNVRTLAADSVTADNASSVEREHPPVAINDRPIIHPPPVVKSRRTRRAATNPATDAPILAPTTKKTQRAKSPPTLEREALSYVGVDPLAEAIWVDAINDQSISSEDRSDLIEDLNEDGFPDPRRPTADDLPMILSRLALIEQLAPDAMDDVNAAAFAEAYKDLVNMYGRVTGER